MSVFSIAGEEIRQRLQEQVKAGSQVDLFARGQLILCKKTSERVAEYKSRQEASVICATVERLDKAVARVLSRAERLDKAVARVLSRDLQDTSQGRSQCDLFARFGDLI